MDGNELFVNADGLKPLLTDFDKLMAHLCNYKNGALENLNNGLMLKINEKLKDALELIQNFGQTENIIHNEEDEQNEQNLNCFEKFDRADQNAETNIGKVILNDLYPQDKVLKIASETTETATFNETVEDNEKLGKIDMIQQKQNEIVSTTDKNFEKESNGGKIDDLQKLKADLLDPSLLEDSDSDGNTIFQKGKIKVKEKRGKFKWIEKWHIYFGIILMIMLFGFGYFQSMKILEHNLKTSSPLNLKAHKLLFPDLGFEKPAEKLHDATDYSDVNQNYFDLPEIYPGKETAHKATITHRKSIFEENVLGFAQMQIILIFLYLCFEIITKCFVPHIHRKYFYFIQLIYKWYNPKRKWKKPRIKILHVQKGTQIRSQSAPPNLTYSETTTPQDKAKIIRKSSLNLLQETITAAKIDSEKLNSPHELITAELNESDAIFYKAKAFIPGYVNGEPITILLDCGAGISIITSKCLQSLGIQRINNFSINLAGVATNNVSTSGQAEINLKIAGVENLVAISIVKTKQSTNYDVILGWDLFAKYPAYKIDAANKIIEMGDIRAQINFVDSTVDDEFELKFQPTDCPDEFKKELHDLISEFGSIFSQSEMDLGCCKIMCPTLKLTGPPPPPAKPYRVAEKLKPVAKQYIASMVDAEIWEKKNTPHVVPIILIPKTSGQCRVVADLRSLNKVLEDIPQPLPRIEDLLNRAGGAYWFSVIDFSNGFSQILMDEASSKLCGIVTSEGIFRYKRLPQGLKISPAVFVQIMEQVMKGLDAVALIYLDDVLIFSFEKDVTIHLKALRSVLERIRDSNMKIRHDKCHFVKRKVVYVGHEINENGYQPSHGHIAALLNYPEPTDKKTVRAFLGLIGYFRRFVENFATTAAPLTALLSKKVKFEWNDEHRNAFKTLITKLTEPPILRPPDYSLPFTVHTDACYQGLGGSILQEIDGKTHAVSFISRTLTDAERNYAIPELELLALVYILKHEYHILYGCKINWYCDHKPITFLKTKLPTSARLTRWILTIQEFDINFHYLPGPQNLVADALSRNPAQMNLVDEDEEDEDQEINIENPEVSNILNNKSQWLRKLALDDPILKQVVQAARKGWPNHCEDDPELLPYYKLRNTIKVQFNIPFNLDKIIVPSNARTTVLKMLHRSHQGITKTKSLARMYFFWPGITKDIEDWINACDTCQRLKPDQQEGPIHKWPPSTRPWERVHIDYCGPINNFQWLVVVDSFSRYPFVFKTKLINTKSTIHLLHPILQIFGYMETIVSDNAKSFTSADFVNYFKNNNTKVLNSPPYHPQSNGLAERFVRTFKEAVTRITEHDNISFDKAVDQFLMDYRITPHETTGESPAFLFLNRIPQSPYSSLIPLHGKDEIKAQKQTAKFAHRKEIEFDTGALVWYKDLNGKWAKGTINERQSETTYKVKDEMDHRLHHKHRDHLRHRKLLPSRLSNTEITTNSEADANTLYANPTTDSDATASDNLSDNEYFDADPGTQLQGHESILARERKGG